jgi:hypothetical protein
MALPAVHEDDPVGLIPLLQGRHRLPPGQGNVTSMPTKHFPQNFPKK